jgi:hypothetical protein
MSGARSIKIVWPQTVLEWIVIVVVVLVLIALLAPVRTIDPSPTGRDICRHHFRQLGLALYSYHDDYGCFPPAYVADANGRPMHSWRVLILPYLDQGELYQQYRFDEPWDGPHNSQLADRIPAIYQCSGDAHEREKPQPWTSYVAVIGPHTCWPGDVPLKLDDITDPADRTLLVVETAASGIHWMEPRDLNVMQMPLTINPPSGQGISSVHKAGAHVLKADGSAWFLGAEQTRPEDLRRYLERDDGEPTPEM